MAGLIAASVWSNILWAGGHRREENFLSSYYCVFDYDDGLTIDKALELFSKYQFILGTTKSHQIDKGKNKPACDRFRVVVPWQKPIAKIDVYRFNIKKAIAHFKSDPVAYDGARLWQPCKKIVASSYEGKLMPVQWELPDEDKSENLNQKFEDVKKYYEETNSVPAYVRDFLCGIYNEGEINTVLFKTCVALFNRGLSYEEILTKMNRLTHLKDHQDLETTIKSAKRTSQR